MVIYDGLEKSRSYSEFLSRLAFELFGFRGSPTQSQRVAVELVDALYFVVSRDWFAGVKLPATEQLGRKIIGPLAVAGLLDEVDLFRVRRGIKFEIRCLLRLGAFHDNSYLVFFDQDEHLLCLFFW